MCFCLWMWWWSFGLLLLATHGAGYLLYGLVGMLGSALSWDSTACLVHCCGVNVFVSCLSFPFHVCLSPIHVLISPASRFPSTALCSTLCLILVGNMLSTAPPFLLIV